MSEFKFSCPQCSQHIQCDTGYVGKQINCPICQRVIVVPQSPRAGVPAASPPVAMKSRILRNVLVITAVVLVLAGLIVGFFFRSNVRIVSAVYGSGSNFEDVSYRVSNLVHQRSEFNAQPAWLKADPTPGWNKTLVIVYKVKGQRHVFTTGEGGKVSAAILLKTASQ
jgi:ribosomal protein S27E